MLQGLPPSVNRSLGVGILAPPLQKNPARHLKVESLFNDVSVSPNFGQYLPFTQSLHEFYDTRPVASPYLPGGHGVYF